MLLGWLVAIVNAERLDVCLSNGGLGAALGKILLTVYAGTITNVLGVVETKMTAQGGLTTSERAACADYAFPVRLGMPAAGGWNWGEDDPHPHDARRIMRMVVIND